MRQRALKKEISSLLQSGDLAAVLNLQKNNPSHRLINPLVGCLCNTDEMVKWLAVSGLGKIISKVADQKMEAARVVMRRFMWMLNDESGGIGWGVPEAMGEVMACHAGLAEEYAHILVANMREEGNFLELEMLQRGLMWGMGRLCGARPELMRAKNAGLYLPYYLDSTDTEVRGRAVWAISQLGDKDASEKLKALADDHSSFTIYSEGKIQQFTIGESVAEVLAK
jgi:hypothetical protein